MASRKIGNILLLLCSTAIYATFGLSGIVFILISAISTYLAAKYMKKNKRLIFYSVLCLNLSLLVFFKFYTLSTFLKGKILVPLGISYYTFQVLGYLIDVYKDKYKPEKSIFNYLLFVMYIPYLFIGPINRYDKVKTTLFKDRTIKKDNLLNGLIRIIFGLFKKYVIAARIGIIVGTISSNPTTYFGAYVFLALILYSFQLYSDFSGGIDVVLGISKILNIELEENFNTPYLSENIREFWRRWHMSLSNWFKDYVYIPLGGNRCSKLRNKINLMITFIVSGLWHGINYFFWGVFHGLLVAFCPKRYSDFKVLNIIFNFIIVSLLWIFFIYPTTALAFKMLISIGYQFNGIDLIHNIFNLGLNKIDFIIMLFNILLIILIDVNYSKIKEKVYELKDDKKVLIIASIVLIILLFGVYGLGFEVSDFIYSKF